MRDHVQRGVHAAKDSIRYDALDQRPLSYALDRLQAVADQLRQKDHQRRQRDRPLRERSEYADYRGRDGGANQRAADSERVHDA